MNITAAFEDLKNIEQYEDGWIGHNGEGLKVPSSVISQCRKVLNYIASIKEYNHAAAQEEMYVFPVVDGTISIEWNETMRRNRWFIIVIDETKTDFCVGFIKADRNQLMMLDETISNDSEDYFKWLLKAIAIYYDDSSE
jgi:hypothetical protein